MTREMVQYIELVLYVPKRFRPCALRPRTVHPDFFMSLYVSSLKDLGCSKPPHTFHPMKRGVLSNFCSLISCVEKIRNTQ
jgi:hypothetical protein